VETVQYGKFLIVSCNIPEVVGDVMVDSAVGQYVVDGHVHDCTVVSAVYVVSSVGQEEGNTVVSVVPAGGTIF
jgi:hypothetical protein